MTDRRRRPQATPTRLYSTSEQILARFFVVAGVLFVAISTVIEVITWFIDVEYRYLIWTVLPAFVTLLCLAGLSEDKSQRRAEGLRPQSLPASDLRTRTIRYHGWLTGSTAPVTDTPSSIVTTWQDAERSAALWMRSNSYPDARLTPQGPDGGVDVISSRAIAQVKFTGSPVGPRFVEQLAGTVMRSQYRGRTALFFSAAGYTEPALRAGRELGVELYRLGGAGQWVRAA